MAAGFFPPASPDCIVLRSRGRYYLFSICSERERKREREREFEVLRRRGMENGGPDARGERESGCVYTGTVASLASAAVVPCKRRYCATGESAVAHQDR